MKQSTAIKMLPNVQSKSAARTVKRAMGARAPAEAMRSELQRFLKKLARNNEFNEKQLSLPGLLAE